MITPSYSTLFLHANHNSRLIPYSLYSKSKLGIARQVIHGMFDEIASLALNKGANLAQYEFRIAELAIVKIDLPIEKQAQTLWNKILKWARFFFFYALGVTLKVISWLIAPSLALTKYRYYLKIVEQHNVVAKKLDPLSHWLKPHSFLVLHENPFFQKLPNELITSILASLHSMPAIVHFASTCKQAYHIASDLQLKKSLFKQNLRLQLYPPFLIKSLSQARLDQLPTAILPPQFIHLLQNLSQFDALFNRADLNYDDLKQALESKNIPDACYASSIVDCLEVQGGIKNEGAPIKKFYFGQQCGLIAYLEPISSVHPALLFIPFKQKWLIFHAGAYGRDISFLFFFNKDLFHKLLIDYLERLFNHKSCGYPSVTQNGKDIQEHFASQNGVLAPGFQLRSISS